MIMQSTAAAPPTPADLIQSPGSEASDVRPRTSAGTDAIPAAVAEVCDVSYVQADVLASVRPALVQPRDAAALAATFAVLGDPTRVRLLDALAQRELCVCELAELVGSTESAVSHQLRLLRSLRLVRSRRAGRQVYYALDDDHIRALLTQGRTHIEEGAR
jgi:ArsR family transcriptional regulator, lead/cadmium/zinc/bismuth-responsive transcriptional repressor